jgi:hypothetical protein
MKKMYTKVVALGLLSTASAVSPAVVGSMCLRGGHHGFSDLTALPGASIPFAVFKACLAPRGAGAGRVAECTEVGCDVLPDLCALGLTCVCVVRNAIRRRACFRLRHRE